MRVRGGRVVGCGVGVYWRVSRSSDKRVVGYGGGGDPRRERVWGWVVLGGMGAVTLCILALAGVVVWLVFHWLWR